MNGLVAIIGSIICAILVGLFIVVRVKKGGVLGLYTKILASFGFVLLGLLLSLEKTTFGDVFNLAAILICAGLVCGLIGDIVLDLKVVYADDSDKHLPVGMLSFGIGHFFYIAAMALAISAEVDFFSWNVFWKIALDIVATAGITAIIWFVSTNVLKLDFKQHLWPTLIYTFILVFVVAFSLTFAIAVPATKLWVMVIGAVLFFLSDLVLSMQYFGGKQADKNLIAINHTLYYAAQIVIALFIFVL